MERSDDIPGFDGMLHSGGMILVMANNAGQSISPASYACFASRNRCADLTAVSCALNRWSPSEWVTAAANPPGVSHYENAAAAWA